MRSFITSVTAITSKPVYPQGPALCAVVGAACTTLGDGVPSKKR